MAYYYLLYRKGNWGSERLVHLLMDTQLVDYGATLYSVRLNVYGLNHWAHFPGALGLEGSLWVLCLCLTDSERNQPETLYLLRDMIGEKCGGVGDGTCAFLWNFDEILFVGNSIQNESDPVSPLIITSGEWGI